MIDDYMHMGIKIKWVVAYRTGGPFGMSDVRELHHNIRQFYRKSEVEFVVYSDDPLCKVYCDRVERLKANWSMGRWSVQECFREPGPAFFTGLDTVLLTRIDPLLKVIVNLKDDQVVMMQPFNKRRAEQGKSASGVMGWNGNQSWLYHTFPHDTFNPNGLEQDRTTTALKKRNYTIMHAQDLQDGIISYKHHWARGNRAGGRILLFHGDPRPGEVQDETIMKLRGTA